MKWKTWKRDITLVVIGSFILSTISGLIVIYLSNQPELKVEVLSSEIDIGTPGERNLDVHFAVWNVGEKPTNPVYFYYKKGPDDSWHHLTGMNQTNPRGIIHYTPPDGPGTYYFACKAKDNAGNYEYGLGYPDAPITRTIYGNPCPGDCTGDGSTNIDDVLSLAENWLASRCGYPMYCNGCDFDGNGIVNLVGYADIAANWLCTP